jgi:ribosome-binding protein aMBF1 (putative translation factor)
MPIIPPFDSDGLLPPGDYELSFDQLRQSGLVRGGGDQTTDSTWDAAWREQLVGGLEILARQLWQVGIREIFADGSFVEDKDHPNDIDGYFVCDLKSLASGVLAQQLNRLDPYKVWTWDPASRRPYRGYPKRQLPMWHRYRVELYPHVPGLGLGSGIRDKFGHEDQIWGTVMIRNEAEYQLATTRLEEERVRLAEHRDRLKATSLSDDEIKRVIDPIESFHLQLKEEVESYERLKRGEFDELENLRGLGQMLISLRIAQGISQRDLAKRLGVHESQVSRDERNEYFGITLERTIRILDALNVRLRTKVEIEPNKREMAVA